MAAPVIGYTVFPGSNCDHDTEHVFSNVLGLPTKRIWHKDTDLSGVDLVVIPGGFSYGDYLRSGAIARFSPVMGEVVRFAAAGGPVIGICNGFQILLESGLLPGAMQHNRDLRFICRDVNIRVETTRTRFTSALRKGDRFRIPVSHGEGNYTIDEEGLQRLLDGDQVLFRYCDEHGQVSEEANVNGSAHAIAGICNSRRNVMGMMPHPERAAEPILGRTDGLKILESMVAGLELPV